MYLHLYLNTAHHCIVDTNEFAEAVESCRGASGGSSLLDDPRREKAWELPIVKRNWDNMLREAGQMSIEPDYWPRSRKRAGLGSMLCWFRWLGLYWTPRVLGLPLPLERALMFVFLILAAAAGGWTVEVCMARPAKTVLAVFQCIWQWMMWLREHFKKPACHRFWRLLG